MYGMPDTDDLDQFSDMEIIAKGAWGEARGLGHDGMQATINTFQNRLSSGVRWWGTTLRQIALHPWQYSCFNRDDTNRAKLISVTAEDPQYATALGLASLAIAGNLNDITNAATHYYDDRMPSMPNWAVGLTPCFVLGTQKYFRVI